MVFLGLVISTLPPLVNKCEKLWSLKKEEKMQFTIVAAFRVEYLEGKSMVQTAHKHMTFSLLYSSLADMSCNGKHIKKENKKTATVDILNYKRLFEKPNKLAHILCFFFFL